MSKKHPTQEQMMEALTKPGPQLNSQRVNEAAPPSQEFGMQVKLHQLRPYDRNPRRLRNPRYDEIKQSIREVGLKQPPPVTQRPGDDKYMISDGGNTRLQILNELYEETGEDHFNTIWVIYRPWISEAHVLAGHLSEDQDHGELAWIEKALGIEQLKHTLEEEAGETLSQRALARQARELGFAVDVSHISRMLYTVEHIWPSLPLTLESGLGRPQIKKIIAYREACLRIWKHIDERPEEEFGPAFHEVLSQFDHEEQTELPWSIVEDRLLGMLEDHSTDIHLFPIDNALKQILTYRQRRWPITDDCQDIWLPLDAEIQRARDPENAPPLWPAEPETENRQPPRMTPRSDDQAPLGDSAGEPVTLETDAEPSHAPASNTPTESPAVGDDDQVSALQEQVRALEAQLAARTEDESDAPTTQEANTVPSPSSTTEESDDTASTESLEALLDDRRDALTLSEVEEPAGHRRLRDMLTREHGEAPNDFDDNALRAIPLMSNGPMHPITDLWYVEPQYREPRELRIQISQFAQALARWAGFNMPGDSYNPVQPTYEEGLGYTLEPLSEEQAQSQRAQRVWQLLASLLGEEELNPAYPMELSVLGALVGGTDDDERLPDEVLVRLFRLIRLIRLLKDALAEEDAS
ncbi:ParB N-terminal domain-containing protein [Halomonas sabkhae]|uniref:ParB family protein n=1 Tax=Halomonas sabkhae TaxID=626223 RepID=UPI0025B51E75|nr:ParB family protein [Halomonas sabkhae]MDN3525351.1 ParB N-terminal domain-containing protein [Halomonas sabkhae]